MESGGGVRPSFDGGQKQQICRPSEADSDSGLLGLPTKVLRGLSLSLVGQTQQMLVCWNEQVAAFRKET